MGRMNLSRWNYGPSFQERVEKHKYHTQNKTSFRRSKISISRLLRLKMNKKNLLIMKLVEIQNFEFLIFSMFVIGWKMLVFLQALQSLHA